MRISLKNMESITFGKYCLSFSDISVVFKEIIVDEDKIILKSWTISSLDGYLINDYSEDIDHPLILKKGQIKSISGSALKPNNSKQEQFYQFCSAINGNVNTWKDSDQDDEIKQTILESLF